MLFVHFLSQRIEGPFLPGYGGFKIGSWQSVTLFAIVDLHKDYLISLIGAQIVLENGLEYYPQK